MDNKCVNGSWSTEATALLESLKGTPNGVRQPIASSFNQYIAGSGQGPAQTSSHSTQSRSPAQTDGFAAVGHAHTNGVSHGSSSHPQSPQSSESSQDLDANVPNPSQAIPSNKRRRIVTAAGGHAQAKRHQTGLPAQMHPRFHQVSWLNCNQKSGFVNYIPICP